MDEFDFWYAVNNTEVVRLPVNPLETFGATTCSMGSCTSQCLISVLLTLNPY